MKAYVFRIECYETEPWEPWVMTSYGIRGFYDNKEKAIEEVEKIVLDEQVKNNAWRNELAKPMSIDDEVYFAELFCKNTKTHYIISEHEVIK